VRNRGQLDFLGTMLLIDNLRTPTLSKFAVLYSVAGHDDDEFCEYWIVWTVEQINPRVLKIAYGVFMDLQLIFAPAFADCKKVEMIGLPAPIGKELIDNCGNQQFVKTDIQLGRGIVWDDVDITYEFERKQTSATEKPDKNQKRERSPEELQEEQRTTMQEPQSQGRRIVALRPRKE